MTHVKHALLAACAAVLAACATEPVTVSSSEPHGIVDVGNSQFANDIHPVVLQEIDGRQVAGTASDEIPPNVSAVVVEGNFALDPQRAFYLSPGPHRLRLTAIIREDLALTLPSTRRLDDPGGGLLALNVAEGQRYLIGAKVDSARPDQWEPVVYAVDEIPGYESGFEDLDDSLPGD
ncbi:MAG: hypothetical protein ACREVN_09210 [Gammaproteobacteria bacterium]